MKLLAVNSSGFSASVSVACFPDPSTSGMSSANWNVDWSNVQLTEDQNTARYLVPVIKELLESTGFSIEQINRFAITTGPGSFTGLRIGLATVKTLAYAIGAEIVGVNSLAAIAQNACSAGVWQSDRLSIIINAYRRQFFAATFDFEHFASSAATADQITTMVEHDQLISWLDRQQSAVAGPGLSCLNPEDREKLADRILEQDFNATAQGVGELAARVSSPDCDPITLVASYFRGSAAEEKLRK